MGGARAGMDAHDARQPERMDDNTTEVSPLLRAWHAGDEAALEQLMPLVYEELHRLARNYLRGERVDHTLQTTALLHEADLRLAGTNVDWDGRVHFLAVAAQTMRRILVDHGRARNREKRGGGAVRITLEEGLAAAPERGIDVVALDEALERLSALDPRKGRIVEVFYFGGLTYDETAQAVGVSPATVHRELRLARAWLYNELRE
jgi:RNA polymerase sigma factor (TIGR02999 family)